MCSKKKGDGRGTWIENGLIKKELGGYIFINVGATWIAEHRLVSEATKRAKPHNAQHLNSLVCK